MTENGWIDLPHHGPRSWSKPRRLLWRRRFHNRISDMARGNPRFGIQDLFLFHGGEFVFRSGDLDLLSRDKGETP